MSEKDDDLPLNVPVSLDDFNELEKFRQTVRMPRFDDTPPGTFDQTWVELLNDGSELCSSLLSKLLTFARLYNGDESRTIGSLANILSVKRTLVEIKVSLLKLDSPWYKQPVGTVAHAFEMFESVVGEMAAGHPLPEPAPDNGGAPFDRWHRRGLARIAIAEVSAAYPDFARKIDEKELAARWPLPHKKLSIKDDLPSIFGVSAYQISEWRRPRASRKRKEEAKKSKARAKKQASSSKR